MLANVLGRVRRRPVRRVGHAPPSQCTDMVVRRAEDAARSRRQITVADTAVVGQIGCLCRRREQLGADRWWSRCGGRAGCGGGGCRSAASPRQSAPARSLPLRRRRTFVPNTSKAENQCLNHLTCQHLALFLRLSTPLPDTGLRLSAYRLACHRRAAVAVVPPGSWPVAGPLFNQ